MTSAGSNEGTLVEAIAEERFEVDDELRRP